MTTTPTTPTTQLTDDQVLDVKIALDFYARNWREVAKAQRRLAVRADTVAEATQLRATADTNAAAADRVDATRALFRAAATVTVESIF